MKGLVHLCNPAASSAAVGELVVFEVGKVIDLHYLQILTLMMYITYHNFIAERFMAMNIFLKYILGLTYFLHRAVNYFLTYLQTKVVKML